MRLALTIFVPAFLVTAGWLLPSPEATAAPAESAASTYSAKCASCHGGNGRGVIPGTPNFTDAKWQASRTDAQLAHSIKNGKGKTMPAWGKSLSDGQISGLVAHVRSFKK